jgi:hypothetical protein
MRNGATEALSEGSCVTNSKQVRDILKGYKVKLVLQGHLHMIEDIFYTGTHYITGGAVSGSWWNGPRFEFPEGFVVVSVRGDDMTWRYETFGWQAVPE